MPTVANPTSSTPDSGARPDKCFCAFRQKFGKKVHRRMLGLETDIDALIDVVSDGSASAFEQAAAFIGEHDWADQAKMRQVRKDLEYMAVKLHDAELYRNPPKDEAAAQPDNVTQMSGRPTSEPIPHPQEHAGLSITETRDQLYPHELSLEAHAERLQTIEDSLMGAAFLMTPHGPASREYFQEIAARRGGAVVTTDLTSTPIERLAIEYAADRFARKEISPKSARLYRQCIGRFAAAVGPDRPLASISPDEVEKWVARLARRRRPKATRDRVYILRRFYHWAILQGIVAQDATAGIKAPWVAKSPPSRSYPRSRAAQS